MILVCCETVTSMPTAGETELRFPSRHNARPHRCHSFLNEISFLWDIQNSKLITHPSWSCKSQGLYGFHPTGLPVTLNNCHSFQYCVGYWLCHVGSREWWVTKFGVQNVSVTNWFLRVNDVQDNESWLYMLFGLLRNTDISIILLMHKSCHIDLDTFYIDSNLVGPALHWHRYYLQSGRRESTQVLVFAIYSQQWGESLKLHNWFQSINARHGLGKPIAHLISDCESNYLGSLPKYTQFLWGPQHVQAHFIVLLIVDTIKMHVSKISRENTDNLLCFKGIG